ncbi:MAG: hypothetical protein DCF16_16800 [Alphaproteobacteria bacterium]|nr:MAG: hypothetical protein DCF16_16800 [Alphaproteobacteria bacterium]
MKPWLAALAVVAGTLSAAFAQEGAVNAGLELDPAPAPGPAFPGVREYDMERFCGGLNERTRFYPRRALEHGVAGAAVIDCTLTEDGRPHTCQVLRESPGRFGFGEAALRIRCRFQIPVDELATSDTNDLRVYRREGEGEPLRMRSIVRFRLGNP